MREQVAKQVRKYYEYPFKISYEDMLGNIWLYVVK